MYFQEDWKSVPLTSRQAFLADVAALPMLHGRKQIRGKIHKERIKIVTQQAQRRKKMQQKELPELNWIRRAPVVLTRTIAESRLEKHDVGLRMRPTTSGVKLSAFGPSAKDLASPRSRSDTGLSWFTRAGVPRTSRTRCSPVPRQQLLRVST